MLLAASASGHISHAREECHVVTVSVAMHGGMPTIHLLHHVGCDPQPA